MEREVKPMKASRKWVYGLAAVVVATTVLSMASAPPRSQTRLEAVSRENAYLMARHKALRQAAFDLADDFYRQVERDRRVLERAGRGDPAWNAVCSPPAYRTGNDAVLAWLSNQASHVQTLPPGPAAEPAPLHRSESLRTAVGARWALAPPIARKATSREADGGKP